MDIKKIAAKLPPGYAEETAGYDTEQLRDEVIQCESNIKRVLEEMNDDEKLSGAKELVKEMSAPYRDAEKMQRAKIAYLLHLLEERGQLPASE